MTGILFIFLSPSLFFHKKNHLQFGINQLKGHLAAQSFQKCNPNKCDMVVFVAVFLSQIRYAVSYCYCNLPPLYMLLRQDTINTIYVFRQWVDGRVISHFTFLLTLFSLYSLEWQLWGICDKNMQSRALLAQKYLTRRKTGSRIPKILFLIFLQKANIIALFTWGLTK